MVGEDEDVIMISSDGIIIRIPAKDISVFARPSKGVRVMKTNEGEKVATLSITEHETEDESSESDAENDGEVPVTNENAEGEKGGRSRREQRKSDGNRVIPQKVIILLTFHLLLQYIITE